MATIVRTRRKAQLQSQSQSSESQSSSQPTVTLQVTEGFQIPVWYTTATPEQQEEALRIGASLYDTVKSAATSQAVTDIEERKNADVARIRAETGARISDLEQELTATQQQHTHRIAELHDLQRAKELQTRKETQEYVQAQFEGQIHTATQELEATRRSKAQMGEMLEVQKREAVDQAKRQADERIKAIQYELEVQQERMKAIIAGKTALEADRDRDIRVAEERTHALLQHTLDEKERSILRGERFMTGLQETISQQAAEIHALSDLLRKKSTNVKTKGNEYEEIFRAKLVVAYSVDDRFSIEDSARNGVGHAGDYITKHGDNAILWEMKNYDKPVPVSEVDKFRRDMKENPQVRVGVMVSRYTGITGKSSKGNREIEFVEGKMLVYLSEFETMSDDALPFLILLFRQFWNSEFTVDVNESLETAIRMIDRLHKDAVKSKTELRLHRSHMDDTICWMTTLVEDNEAKLHNTLKLLQNNTIAVEVPPGVFRECDGDEKVLQLIQCIMDFCVSDVEGSLILNDLADLVGKRKRFSRDTAKSHIRGVLLDTAFDQPKGKVGRVLGLVLKGDTIQHAV